MPAAEPRLVLSDAGDGATYAHAGDMVAMHYTGRLADGTVFDSSDGHAPLHFVVGAHEVIPCFDEAAGVMAVGASGRLTCPPASAYGARGHGVIPPNAELTFDVTLVDVSRSRGPGAAGNGGGEWDFVESTTQAAMPAVQQMLATFGLGPKVGS